MKKLVFLAVIVLAWTTVGKATTINFDYWPDGSPISAPTEAPYLSITDEFAEWGIIFESTTKIVQHSTPSDLDTPPNCLFPDHSEDSITLDARFVLPEDPLVDATVTGVSFFQDRGAQSGGGTFIAYDINGNEVINESFNTSGKTFHTFDDWGYVGEIHRIYIGYCKDGVDDLKFATPVPEPPCEFSDDFEGTALDKSKWCIFIDALGQGQWPYVSSGFLHSQGYHTRIDSCSTFAAPETGQSVIARASINLAGIIQKFGFAPNPNERDGPIAGYYFDTVEGPADTVRAIAWFQPASGDPNNLLDDEIEVTWYEFHEFAIERTPSEVIYSIDGQEVARVADAFAGALPVGVWNDRSSLMLTDWVEVNCESATLELLTPNGGEVLVAGSNYDITWEPDGSISDVLIKYSTDNGGNWTPVDPPNVGNIGSYNWLVPAVSSDQCLVQVSDASDPCTSDTSDALFTIRLGTIYVDDDASPGGDGASWGTAYKYLQDALSVAQNGDEIWVAEGIYKPASDFDPCDPCAPAPYCTATFQLKNGAALYGGFAGGETGLDQRDWQTNETILSGDLLGNDGPGEWQNNGENSYNVVTGSGTDATTILDGFTITAGNANGSDPYRRGGGMYNYQGSPTIRNCTFSGNSAYFMGGGMENLASSPKVTNCIFGGNKALYGGGMSNESSSPKVTNCTFIRNSASQRGAAMFNIGASPTLTNCTFSGNSASYGGGVANLESGNPILINCTFSGNSATEGSVIANSGPYSVLTNCILWGNTGGQIYVMGFGGLNLNYCNIQGGWAGDGNINADPNFVDADGPDDIIGTEDDNLRLLYGSPCINAGDNNAVPPEITTDIDGNPRIVNGTVDMGAYEYVGEGALPDLEITSEDITFGAYPAVPGEPNSISATVCNRGNIPAINIEVSFADSSGPIGSNQTIPILDPNQSETVSIQHSWPETGYQLITVAVDPFENLGRGRDVGRGDRIEELDETNNTASKVYQIGYPADANAILNVSWNSAPACYTEGTSAVIQGKAEYRIEITGADDIVSAALGSIVTAQIIDSNGVVSNLQSTLTGPGGYFYIPFIVPGADYEAFTIEISVTDGTLTGAWEKLFCIQHDIQDLWICELTVSNDTPDIDDIVSVCATVCAAPDNAETVLNIPVTFYAYPPAGGADQIGQTQYIDQMAGGDSNSVCVDWTPTVNGLHRIRAIIGPGYSDDNNGNNYRYYTVVVGMFNVTTSPKWATIGQQVQITVDSREPLAGDDLDGITVVDNSANPIPFSPADPNHPTPTRWVYVTDPLPPETALGTATITVTGTDSGSVQHTGEGYFEVYETEETKPDFWLHSCDISFSDLNPELGEPITIDAVVHADSSNPETEPDIPVTFYSKHLPSGGEYIKIYQTQYTGDIVAGGVSTPVSVPWQNAAKGEYVIKVQLGPGFSDRNNGNNAATRAILVGDDIPFDVEFEVVNKRRTGRWEFEYDCNAIMHNQTGLTLENVELELTGVSSNMTIVNPPYTATFADIGPNGSAPSENMCTFSVNRLEEIDSGQIHWDLIYQIVDICGIMKQGSTSVILFDPIVLGDITGEGAIDILDLLLLATDWLHSDSLADIAPSHQGDGIVNLADFASFAQHWLEDYNQ